MKNIFIFSLIFMATNTFGQVVNNKANGIILTPKATTNNDTTTIKIIYADKAHKAQTPAYFLNGQFAGQAIATLKPKLIDSFTVVKSPIQVGNIEYSGQIHIKTKTNYNPRLISLNALKDRYTNLKDKPVMFTIDGNLVNAADYDQYMIDESDLLTIIVDKVENPKENIDLGLIKLLTKSDENIKKSKEIIIRGTEVAVNK